MDGTVCGLKYNGTAYYFYKNLQGDVIAITDETGAVVARYSYDAWGKCTIVSDTSGIDIANINPFRYRSYYYDSEIGMYYLQSRYYDPEVGRFINADDVDFFHVLTIIGCSNSFAYCKNNVVNYKDKFGYVAGVDDVAVLALIVIVLTLLAVTAAWMSMPEFMETWMAFCTDVGNGLAGLGGEIANGAEAAWSWTKAQVKKVTSELKDFLTVVKADAKIKSKVRRNSKQRYWIANILKLRNYTYVVISSAISYNVAKNRVASGKSVFTVTRTEARKLATNFPPVLVECGDKQHGQYRHYHVNVKGKKRYNKAHVFFLF